MIRRKDNSTIGYVIDTSADDQELAWCERCEKRGDKTRLGEKILMDNQPPAPDHDSWMQCPKCYLLVPIFNVKYEGEIYSDLDVEDNPFDYAKADILGVDSRLKSRVRRVKQRHEATGDKEIDLMVKDGWEVTGYSEDIPQEASSQGFSY